MHAWAWVGYSTGARSVTLTHAFKIWHTLRYQLSYSPRTNPSLSIYTTTTSNRLSPVNLATTEYEYFPLFSQRIGEVPHHMCLYARNDMNCRWTERNTFISIYSFFFFILFQFICTQYSTHPFSCHTNKIKYANCTKAYQIKVSIKYRVQLKVWIWTVYQWTCQFYYIYIDKLI